jgi:hypothetical protein
MRVLRLGRRKAGSWETATASVRPLGIDVRRGVLRYQGVVDGRAVTVHLLKMQDIARRP